MKRIHTNTAVLISVVALCAPASWAGTHWELATIEKISSNKFGDVQIKLDKSAATACDSKYIVLLPNENGRLDALLSKAMFAYTTGEKIHLYGSGQCNGEFEILGSIAKS